MKKLLVVAGMLAGVAFWTPAFAQTKLYRPRLLRHRVEAYAARAAG